MSDSGKPRGYCTKRARKVRRKRLEFWRMRSVGLMDNFKPPETDGPVFVDGICCRKKRRSGIDEAPSLQPEIAAAKGSKSDAGDRSLALERSVSVSVSSGKSPEDGASPIGKLIACGEVCEDAEEEGMSKSTCISHGSISVIGRRRVMEDAVTVVPEMVPGEFSFFAVYDGHGGSRVANACRDRLHQLLLNELYSRESPAGVSVGLEVGAEIDWEKVMMACFGKMDEEVSGGGTEADGASASATMVGSTALVVLVGKEEIVVANCGDSRAVLGGGGGAVPLSHDHKVMCH